uniref:Uncharacterized protein n=1 Tax=Steinernema glaseri TaxID=37863 RepID=A0A1I7YYZ7_9BILA
MTSPEGPMFGIRFSSAAARTNKLIILTPREDTARTQRSLRDANRRETLFAETSLTTDRRELLGELRVQRSEKRRRSFDWAFLD